MPFNPNQPYQSGKGADYDRMTSEEKKRYHERYGGNFDWSGAAKGAATGAIAGGMTPAGPWGALVGGLGGGYVGGRAGAEQNKANSIQQGAMDDAIARQEQLRQEMEARRERDLANTMAFYGPAMAGLERLYGIPASGFGPGAPGNAPKPPPLPTGVGLNGRTYVDAYPGKLGPLLPMGRQPAPAGFRLSAGASSLGPLSDMTRKRLG